MKFLVLCVILGFASADSSVSVRDQGNYGIPCDRIKNIVWDYIGNQLTCIVDEGRIYNSSSWITTSRNENVTILSMGRNHGVKYLPIGLKETFPNLIGIFARNASIGSIYPANFEGLGKLRYLHLGMNHIQRIANETFDGARSLEWLMLDDNDIEFMHGQALKKLDKLTHVNMYLNECIDKDFDTPELIQDLQRMVTYRCGQCPDNTKVSNCEVMAQIYKTQTGNYYDYEKFVNKLSGMLHDHTDKMGYYFGEVSKLWLDANIRNATLYEQIQCARQARDTFKYQANVHTAYSKKAHAEKVELETKNAQLKKDIMAVQVKLNAQKQDFAAKQMTVTKKTADLDDLKAKVDKLNRKVAELGSHYCE